MTNEGWQEKLEAFIDRVNVWVELPWEELSRRDVDRLTPKIHMVQEAAAKLALAMIKGTLKYDTDDWSVDKWVEFGVDDASDALNYWYLLREALKVEREYLGARA
jgi:hypothetical protein